MISKSVRAKRRRNAVLYKRIGEIKVYRVDTRCDAWLVSQPQRWGDVNGPHEHHDIYGRRVADKRYAEMVQRACREFKNK